MICPNCKKEIDLPFEVEICPYCNLNITKPSDDKLADSVLVTSNPFVEHNINYPILPIGSKYLDKYEVKEHLANKYPFSYYLVSNNNTKFILQIINTPPLDSLEIEKKLKKEFNSAIDPEIEENITIIEYGLKNNNIYFLLEYFTLETVEETLNTTTNLSDEYILNLIMFLSDWYEHIQKPHIFLSPSNIINMGNNQFKVFNYKVLKVLSNFIKPFFFFKENISKYLSPELLKGDRLITKKSDIYSIGKIWKTLIDSNFDISEKEDSNIKKRIKDIVKNMILENYEERKLDKKELKDIIENYLNKKNNDEFTTQKISLDDILIEEDILTDSKPEEDKYISNPETKELKPISEDIELQEIEELKPINEEIELEEIEELKPINEEIEFEEIKIEEAEELKVIKEEIKSETKESKPIGEEIELEEIEEINIVKEKHLDEIEIEPEIIIKKASPPSIPIAPPSLRIKKVTEKEFKIAKKQLNKNPIDLDNLKLLYSYYSDKEMIDEAFIVSNLLNFMNDKTNSNLLFKSGKDVDWNFSKSILTENNLQKILPKKIYFNTSGVMQVLYKILKDDLQIIKMIQPLSNYSIPINSPEKKEIIKKTLKLSGLDNLKISLTNQDIHNEKNIATAIFKRDNVVNIILKKDLCENMENTQFRVLFSKLIFLTHPNIVSNFLYDVQTIKDIFYGVMKFVIPSSRNMYNSKISNILFKELESQKKQNKLKRTDMLRLVMLMNEHLYSRKAQPNINESMKLIEIASDRFALIVSNNLNETLKTFLNYENVNIKLTASERMKSLLKYVLSDEYFQLRKDIKQSVKA